MVSCHALLNLEGRNGLKSGRAWHEAAGEGLGDFDCKKPEIEKKIVPVWI
jgi:hypothetical protein